LYESKSAAGEEISFYASEAAVGEEINCMHTVSTCSMGGDKLYALESAAGEEISLYASEAAAGEEIRCMHQKVQLVRRLVVCINKCSR
jgi:hypothetical protein